MSWRCVGPVAVGCSLEKWGEGGEPCKGSCMFLEAEFFKQSYANEFAFNMGIMMAAVWH